MIVGAPPLQPAGFCKKFKGLVRANYASYWQGGLTCSAIFTPIVFSIILFFSLYTPKLIPNPALSYDQISQVYPDYIPLELMYNANDLTTGEDTSMLMTPLIDSQNTEILSLEANPQDWQYGDDISLYDIIIDIGKLLDNDQKAAYFVLDTGE